MQRTPWRIPSGEECSVVLQRLQWIRTFFIFFHPINPNSEVSMFEQGYIMREVQKMVQMLQAVTGLKREKKLDEALQKIDESYDRFFDLHSTEVKMDKLNDLIRCCSREGEFSSDLGFALADIIYEEAKILEAQKQEKKADEKFGIVLELYQHSSAEKNAAVPLNAIQKMKKVQQRLDGIKK